MSPLENIKCGDLKPGDLIALRDDTYSVLMIIAAAPDRRHGHRNQITLTIMWLWQAGEPRSTIVQNNYMNDSRIFYLVKRNDEKD